MGSWDIAAVEKAQRRTESAQERTKGAQAGNPSPTINEAIVAPALPLPAFGTAGGPCAWLYAAGTVSVALAGNHFGDRHRVLLTGPKDAGLLQAVLAAVEAYCSTGN